MEGPPASAEVLDLDQLKLQAEVLKLREQVRKLGAVILSAGHLTGRFPWMTLPVVIKQL